ncbi:UDP-glucuronosyltransferase 2A3-like [Rhopilema esculentum]|uniref:UDP-glucuronosyltransferase 2A3-like n=1 Tax=Rhopilema esculentum TaxID=499914 RepID=UPI0031CEB14A
MRSGIFSSTLISTFVLLTLHWNGACEEGGSNIVFMTVPMVHSHYFNGMGLAEEMARRGHKVSILVTEQLKTRKSIVKHVEYRLRDAELVNSINEVYNDVSKKEFGAMAFINFVKDLIRLFVDACFAILENEQTLKEIKEADMIVAITSMSCAYYLGDIFDKPVISLHTSAFYFLSQFTGAPSVPSHVPAATIALSDEMTFFERIQNFISYRLYDAIESHGTTYYFRELQAAYGWRSSGSFPEVIGKTELFIFTTDFSYQHAQPIMPNTFFVGPLLAKPPAPLSEDLEEFMQSSNEHGVVLIAFGSAASEMDQTTIEAMLTAISRMKQKFIWKLEATENLKIPQNLKALKWVPQNDILGHKKTKAFVSHMGLNGAAEAAYHGVPIVAAPFKGERFHNAVLFTKKAKMAKFIDIINAGADTWQSTMEEVVYNSSYKEHAMMTSKRMRSWPKSGTERAGDLVQYALDNGGRLPHLKSNANTLYWFQYYCVDVIAFLLALAVILPCLFCKVLKFLISFLWKNRTKSKEE